jgi:hypothetical protein
MRKLTDLQMEILRSRCVEDYEQSARRHGYDYIHGSLYVGSLVCRKSWHMLTSHRAVHNFCTSQKAVSNHTGVIGGAHRGGTNHRSGASYKADDS